MPTTNGTPREGVTILRLEAHDFQGLRVAKLENLPGKGLVKVTGPNGAGKSSILRAITGALAGAAEVHERSIRDGAEDGASVDLELTNGLRIRRRHTAANPKGHLTVSTADGASYSAAQSKLDDLLGPLSFDPQAFFSLDSKRQREILLSIGHDPDLAKKLDGLRAERAKLYEERTPWISRQRDARKVAKPQGERPEPVDTGAAMAELRELQGQERERGDQAHLVTAGEAEVARRRAVLKREESEVERLRRELHLAEARVARVREECADAETVVQQARVELDAMPDPADAIQAVQVRISGAEAVQRALKPWESWDDAQVLLAKATDQVADLTRQIKDLQAEEHRLIAEAGIPVRGLSFDEEGAPLLHGRPLELASGGERIELAVDVALAVDPELRVALVDEANDLDLEALDRLRRRAEQHDFQIWLCRIGLEGAGEVRVLAGEAVTAPVGDPAQVGLGPEPMTDRTPQIEPWEGPGDRDGYLVRTPYHEGFIAELKTLSSADRRWDWDGTGAWWVAAEHEDVVRHWLVRYFDGYELVDADTGAVDFFTASGPQARQERFL